MKHLPQILLVVVLAGTCFGQESPNNKRVIFEHGRWEVIDCTIGGNDCTREQFLDRPGPVESARYSLKKKIDEIQCYKDQSLCVIASAGQAEDGFLYVDVQRFFISKWDEQGIEADWFFEGVGKMNQELTITFLKNGRDNVVIADSLKVPKDSRAKDHLIRYQLIYDYSYRHEP